MSQLPQRPAASVDPKRAPNVFDSDNGSRNFKFHRLWGRLGPQTGDEGARPLAKRPAPYQHPPSRIQQEAGMAKGQTRTVKEKKKPKADKDKPKQMSAYKASQMSGTSAANPYAKK
jgi:hypothetical protein